MSMREGRTNGSSAIARRASLDGMSAMNKVFYTLALLAVFSGIASAQTPPRQRQSSDESTTTEANVTRSRIVGPRVANHAEKPKPAPVADADSSPISQGSVPQAAWGNTPIVARPEPSQPAAGAAKGFTGAVEASVTDTVVQSTILPVSSPAASTAARATSSSSSAVTPMAYVVGAGDVLDIRLSNLPTRESTLYTVMKNGTIEYPLLDGPLPVAGIGVDDIAKLLSSQIKVINSPKVSVTVRDFASHTVLITGLVDSPGKKILRREAMPLFAILAESAVRPEATGVTITHNGKEGELISLQNQQALSTLVASGDVIKVSGGSAVVSQFVYVGGEVTSPGEKTFRQGITLTQVLLAAGAGPTTIKTVKVARRSGNGLLSTTEYNVRSIQQGKLPDPLLAAGDRIEVTRY